MLVFRVLFFQCDRVFGRDLYVCADPPESAQFLPLFSALQSTDARVTPGKTGAHLDPVENSSEVQFEKNILKYNIRFLFMLFFSNRFHDGFY